MKRSEALSNDEGKGAAQEPPKRTAAEQRIFLDRLEESMTDEVMDRAFRYARKRVDLLAKCGLAIERGLAKHLLADAISDTALGDASWDPDRCELYVHLRSVIRYRTKDILVRARKYQHDRLYGKPTEDDGTGLGAEASSRVQGRSVAQSAVMGDLATRVSVLLYASAAMNSDPIVERILDAYAAGFTGRSEVAERCGLSLKQFDAARNRLDRLVKKLPEQLAGDAAESMGVRR